MIERWKLIPGFDRYEVSNLARVRRKKILPTTGKKLKVLRPYYVRGIAVVGLRRGGRTYKKVVARLAAEAFGQLVPGSGQRIDHRPGIVVEHHAEILRGAEPHEHSSRFKGVSFNQARRKWFACIRDGRGRTRGLGLFDDEAAAAKAYDKAAFAQWGAAAYRNFPPPR